MSEVRIIIFLTVILHMSRDKCSLLLISKKVRDLDIVHGLLGIHKITFCLFVTCALVSMLVPSHLSLPFLAITNFGIYTIYKMSFSNSACSTLEFAPSSEMPALFLKMCELAKY